MANTVVAQQPISRFQSFGRNELAGMTTKAILNRIDEEGLRTCLGGRQLSENAFIEGQDGYSPVELLRGLRDQLKNKTRNLSPHDKGVVKFYHSFWRVPPMLRQKMFGYLAMTLIPDANHLEFPAEASMWPVEATNFLTLNCRPSALQKNGKPLDSFDIRLHQAELSYKTGTITIGGTRLDEAGQPQSLTTLSRTLNLPPSAEDDDISLCYNKHSNILDLSIDMHEEMEVIAAAGVSCASTPDLPPVYVAIGEDFRRGYNYFNKALQTSTCERIYGWLRVGAPHLPSDESGWADEVQELLKKLQPTDALNWHTVEEVIGHNWAEYLLICEFEQSIIEHEDKQLLPLKFVHDLRQLLVIDKSYFAIRDSLGREVVFGDASHNVADAAKIQAIQLGKVEVQDRPPVYLMNGKTDQVEYNFSGSEIGLEDVMSCDCDYLE